MNDSQAAAAEQHFRSMNGGGGARPGMMHPQYSPQHSAAMNQRFPGKEVFISNCLKDYLLSFVVANTSATLPAGMFPTYNSVPNTLAFNQQQQLLRNQMAGQPNMSQLNFNAQAAAAAAAQQMRPDSQLSFHSQQNALISPNRTLASGYPPPSNQQFIEERHYQNIQLYQLNGPNDATNGPLAKMSPNSAAMSTAQHHQNLMNAAAAQRNMLGGSHSSLQQQPNLDPSKMGTLGRPMSAIISGSHQEQVFNYPGQSGQQPIDPAMLDAQRQRDLMRQEAKMEEIREELRRREDRMLNPAATAAANSYLGTLPRNMSSGNASLMPNTIGGTLRPGLGSNGRFISQQTLNNPASSNALSGSLLMNNGNSLSMGTLRQSIPSGTTAQMALNASRPQQPIVNGPPQTAPKPNRPVSQQQSVQTMHQQQQPVTQVSYRYGPSGYPSGPSPVAVSSQIKTNAPVTEVSSSGAVSPSPWQREEKERVSLCSG